MTDQATFESWAILELMGHRRLGGYVKEQQIAGVGLLRLDVPGEDGQPVATQFYHPNALYCLTPTTEEIAQAVAKANKPKPVERWELPRLEGPRPPVEVRDMAIGDDRELECPGCGRRTQYGEPCDDCEGDDEP